MKDALQRSPRKPQLSWKLQKRKLQLQLLTNFGKELPASDELYEHHEQRFLALLQKLLDIRKSLEYYRTKAFPEYCAACATLGADVWCVVSVDAVGKGTDAEKFRHAMCAINETKEIKGHYFNADEVLAGALRFLDIHINAMKSVKPQIERRKHIKLEFDCYDRKVARLTARKSASPTQLERNRIKLQQAREALQTVTFDLYRVFAKYESERDTMLNGELEMVRQVMNGFYSKNAEATNFQIKEEVDRTGVEVRTEQIYKRMVQREMEKENSRLGPGSANLLPAPPTAILDGAASMGTTPPPPAPVVVSGSDPAMSVDPASSSPDSKELPQLNVPSQQPRVSVDDELSEKLRTIQLSRPKVPPVRGLKPKAANNQTENQIIR